MIAKRWWGGCLVGALSIGVSSSVLAQVVPDNTLGAESSVVTPDNIQGIESDRIDGGATRGANLFHSFQEFNVGEARGVYFANPTGIENILTRVTGSNPSNILGRLGVLGEANLFLLNPNGIIYGPNAQLNVQGSFVGSTASGFTFANGSFSATNPQAPPLLAISVPLGLQYGKNPGSIQLQVSNLRVNPGKTLALVGGNVFIDGGNLTAAGGRIELGSVLGVGEVSLTSTGNRFVLGYDSINDFGNISLSNRAFVDASGEGSGDVQIQGARLEMTQRSNIWANNLGAQNGGGLLVRTKEVVLSESSFLTADVTGTGTGGNLTIDTGRLLVSDGAVVSASTTGEGKGGSLQITADESVDVIGTSTDTQARRSGLLAQSNGSGDAGNLTIDTGRLLVNEGAVVSAGTYGEGKAGNLQITADESVNVIGTSGDTQQPRRSGLLAQSNGSGDAGNLTIETGRLRVSDGAEVSVGTYGKGKGGSLQITADESVDVIGGSGSFGSDLSAQSNGSGDAGNLTIDTGRLLVNEGAVVSAGTTGEGKGAACRLVLMSRSM